MLPIRNRLKLSFYGGGKDFADRRVSGERLTLIYRREPGVFKAAVIVGKKVAPKAVSRNRIKRLIWQALRSQTERNLKAVVIVKKNIASLKAAVVGREIEELFKKIK